jgi:hypothetical protein
VATTLAGPANTRHSILQDIQLSGEEWTVDTAHPANCQGKKKNAQRPTPDDHPDVNPKEKKPKKNPQRLTTTHQDVNPKEKKKKTPTNA